jgi:hypothetical protein
MVMVAENFAPVRTVVLATASVTNQPLEEVATTVVLCTDASA